MRVNYIHDKIDLTDKTILLYAARHYDNPHCHDIDEFYNDLQIPLHLKKLFTRYHVNGVLKDRLILNHIIGFFNVFNSGAAAKILFFKMDEKYYPYLKAVLVALNRCPEGMTINGKYISITNDITADVILLSRLRNI